MTLDKLKCGESGTIIFADFNSAVQKRLSAMGIFIGTRITLLRTAHGGELSEYRIMGYNLAMRRCDAAKITVKRDSD